MFGQFNIHYLAFLIDGAIWTVGLSIIAMMGGGVLGFVIALARISPRDVIRIGAAGYIAIFQGTPVLVIMFVAYFGLPTIGFTVSPLFAASAALILNVGAYLGEIWRGSIRSVPAPQWEAAECLALTRTQRMFRVVLPQAVRIATPPTIGFSVQVIKNTSLASVVGFVELARSGQIINNAIFQPFTVYLIIAVLYFLMCYPLSRMSRLLERRKGSRRETKKGETAYV